MDNLPTGIDLRAAGLDHLEEVEEDLDDLAYDAMKDEIVLNG